MDYEKMNNYKPDSKDFENKFELKKSVDPFVKNLVLKNKPMEYEKMNNYKPDSVDFENKFELKKSVDPNEYSLVEPEKSVTEEVETKDLYEDDKSDFKTILLKDEIDTKKGNYSEETTKPTKNLFFPKSYKNLVRQKKGAKPSENEEHEGNSDLNRPPNTIVEEGANYVNNPVVEEIQNNIALKIYNCLHCNYSTNNKHYHIEHVLIHSDERPFMCGHCSYKSKTKSTLRKHILTMHLPNLAKTSRYKSFKCVSCEASYMYQYSLIKHIQQHHNESGNPRTYNKLTCNICHFSSLNPYVMKNHALTHSMKSFKCEICQFSYSRNDVLKLHILREHTEETLYQCKTCNRKFKTEYGLMNHQRLCAGTGKSKAWNPRFKCNVCAKAYVHKCRLDQHMIAHTRQYPFKCSHCAQGFTTYTLLRYHIYSHSKETLYKCSTSTCSFSTNHRKTMKQHEAKHQKRNNTYKCADCNYFTRKCNMLMIHQEEHNVKGKFECAHCSYSTDVRGRIVQHLRLNCIQAIAN